MRDYRERNPSPQNDKRGCLCKDGKTYSRKCCDGSFQAQGIGSITRTSFYLLTENSENITQENGFKIYK